jgi:chromosome segregation ATPase
MDECTPDIDSTLWRIAELGARCGQRSCAIDRRPMWEELEGLIGDLGGEIRAARHDGPGGAPQIRRLRQELKATARERDAALAEVAEQRDEAVAAQRERDRTRQQLTTETDAARAARQAWQGRLKKVDAARAEAVTALAGVQDRITGLESALQAAIGERDAAVSAREASLAASEDVISQLAARAQGRRPHEMAPT